VEQNIVPEPVAEKVVKPKAPHSIIITVTLPEGVKKITSALGKTYLHTLSEEQSARLKTGKHKNQFEVGKVISVHPQRRQLTVEVPGNRVAWVERVLLGKDEANNFSMKGSETDTLKEVGPEEVNS